MTRPVNTNVEAWDAGLVAATDHGTDVISTILDQARLGPVCSVRVVGSHGVRMIVAELDAASPRRAATLRRWLSHLTVVDMTAGEYRRNDTHLRLNIRGVSPHGIPICVVAPFHQRNEPVQVVLIRAGVEQQCPRELVENLVAFERQRDQFQEEP